VLAGLGAPRNIFISPDGQRATSDVKETELL
jgi:hypothetical protein